MKSELIVDVQPKEVSIALLEDSRLVSLQKEARDMAFAVGDIYLAKVKKLMPGLNAAFVNVGYEKDAFLHYLDLGPAFSSYSAYVEGLLDRDRPEPPVLEQMELLPHIDKQGSIADTVKPGQELLVQIVKEPISSKGPRLTTELTFTGRFMVLIPFGDKISISQKIKSQEEKMRLRQLIESIKPRNFSVIVRTSAEGKRVAELIHELKSLVNSWNETVAKARRATAPALIYQEESRIVGMLRDVFSPSFEAIHVNDDDVREQIHRYVRLIAPEAADIVRPYDSDIPIFDHFGITRQIKSSFGKTVSFRSGAYIIIESTEALHVVDVNSGNRTKGATDQETNALEVNLRAADEIARQLRLRDMGGIIVVDFIDMAKGEHRQQLFEHMREVMAHDRARHNILPLSKFGLMQITRQRVRPALSITTVENCPSCYGKGEVQPSLLFTDTLCEKIDYMVNTLSMSGFTVYVHPFVDAYIKRGIFTSLYGKWRRRFGRVFRILPDESLAYLQYKVFDSNRLEVDLKEEKDLNASSASKSANKARNRGEAPDELSDLEIAESAAPASAADAKSKKTPAPASVGDARSQKRESPASVGDARSQKRECPDSVGDARSQSASQSDSTPAAKKTRRKKAAKKAAPSESESADTQETFDLLSPGNATRGKAKPTRERLPLLPPIASTEAILGIAEEKIGKFPAKKAAKKAEAPSQAEGAGENSPEASNLHSPGVEAPGARESAEDSVGDARSQPASPQEESPKPRKKRAPKKPAKKAEAPSESESANTPEASNPLSPAVATREERESAEDSVGDARSQPASPREKAPKPRKKRTPRKTSKKPEAPSESESAITPEASNI